MQFTELPFPFVEKSFDGQGKIIHLAGRMDRQCKFVVFLFHGFDQPDLRQFFQRGADVIGGDLQQRYQHPVSVRRFFLQLLRRTVEHQFAAVDDDDPGADRFDLFENVGGNDDRLAFAHLPDQLAHFVLLVRVEAVGRLVQNQHRRIVQDRLREADPVMVDRVSMDWCITFSR